MYNLRWGKETRIESFITLQLHKPMSNAHEIQQTYRKPSNFIHRSHLKISDIHRLATWGLRDIGSGIRCGGSSWSGCVSTDLILIIRINVGWLSRWRMLQWPLASEQNNYFRHWRSWSSWRLSAHQSDLYVVFHFFCCIVFCVQGFVHQLQMSVILMQFPCLLQHKIGESKTHKELANISNVL